tara:strand:+ start:649 stop:837 length:189 start_codon:yes stop_codon:yes gene_type:complete
MKKSTIIKKWGSLAAAASELRLTRSAVSQWPDPIPKSWAYLLEAAAELRDLKAANAEKKAKK